MRRPLLKRIPYQTLTVIETNCNFISNDYQEVMTPLMLTLFFTCSNTSLISTTVHLTVEPVLPKSLYCIVNLCTCFDKPNNKAIGMNCEKLLFSSYLNKLLIIRPFKVNAKKKKKFGFTLHLISKPLTPIHKCQKTLVKL